MRFFITGTAGFIGFHLARRLIDDGHTVVGFDALTEYYDRQLKISRNEILSRSKNFQSVVGRLEDWQALDRAAQIADPEVIVHLAAQAGVRYSIENPQEYVDTNLVGSFNVLELAKRLRPSHLLLASTSSIYGGNQDFPYSEAQAADWPLSFYAATKKAMEAMSHSYSHLWNLPTTCFRFFTVYGPWGRPDMALFKFVSAALSDRPIEIYGMGEMRRDFTYVDDLVEAIIRLIVKPPSKNSLGESQCGGSATAPWRVINIGGGQPVGLLDFVEAIEAAIGFPIKKIMLPMQPGDMRETFADPQTLVELTGLRPQTSINYGVAAFVEWYREHYKHQFSKI